MAASNRVRLTMVREVTAGTTPNTPRMRTARITGESLSFTPEYIDSDELRSDRMLGDPIKVMQGSQGGLNFELSFPDDNSPLSEILRSGFFNAWSNTNYRDNDGTADSVITAVATTNEVLTVTTGTSFVAGELYRFTGFGVVGNNGIFKCTTGSATVPRFVGSGLTDETVPPAAARVKLVGFQGASDDITATSTGLASSLLDFTTITALAVGKWIKIGGTASGDKFDTAALNDYARIIAVSTNAITLDNRPSGWTTDSGSGKTIKVWVGDQIKNGTTPTSLSIEKGFMDQTSPTYIVNTGMQVNNLSLTIASRQKITGSATFMGMGGSESTASLDASPDAATTGQVFAANANVGRVSENGAQVTGPNYVREISLQIANNLRTVEDVGQASPVAINPGECTATGRLSTYFGSDTTLAKLYAGTPTSVSARVTKNSQTIVLQLPRVTLRTGVPAAGAKNQDVMLDSDITASIDTTYTNASVLLDRMEYVE